MMIRMNYWKANKTLSRQIIELLDARLDRIRELSDLCVKHGADPTGIYTSSMSVDLNWLKALNHKKLVRLKHTEDGWRPKASTKLGKQLNN